MDSKEQEGCLHTENMLRAVGWEEEVVGHNNRSCDETLSGGQMGRGEVLARGPTQILCYCVCGT